MSLRRTSRRVLACVLAAAVLFAQTAAVAYACVRVGEAGYEAVSVEAMPCPSHADAAPSGGPAENANLCQVHCQATALPDAPGIVPMPVAITTSHPVGTRDVHSSTALATHPETLGAPSPPALQYPRLLI